MDVANKMQRRLNSVVQRVPSKQPHQLLQPRVLQTLMRVPAQAGKKNYLPYDDERICPRPGAEPRRVYNRPKTGPTLLKAQRLLFVFPRQQAVDLLGAAVSSSVREPPVSPRFSHNKDNSWKTHTFLCTLLCYISRMWTEHMQVLGGA